MNFEIDQEIYLKPSMFWDWFYDLNAISFGARRAMCSNCGIYPASDCGHGHFDAYTNEFDCDLEFPYACEECPYCYCEYCKEQYFRSHPKEKEYV